MKTWIKQFFCSHDWVPSGGVQYYCHALSPFAAAGSYLAERRLAKQAFRCSKCNKYHRKEWFEGGE